MDNNEINAAWFINKYHCNPESIKVVMINEVVPEDVKDDFYVPDSSYSQSIIGLFSNAGIDVYKRQGFVSMDSHITVRILSKNLNDVFDRAFFKQRIQFAYAFRKTLEAENLTNCRLIFGEADQLPGLTVDRYNDILVAQISSFGMDKIKDMLYEVLLEVLKEDGQNVKGL